MNTLEIIEILESKGFDNKNAINLAEAINGKSEFSNKEDLMKVKHELKETINELKQDIK